MGTLPKKRLDDLFLQLQDIGSQIEVLESMYEKDKEIEHALSELWDDVYDVIMFVVMPKRYSMTLQEYITKTHKVLKKANSKTQPQRKPIEPKPSIPVVERPAYEPKPASSKRKTNSDRRVDICKPDTTEWIECHDYEDAASKIGCNFNTVLTAIRFKKDEVHGWKIRKHED